MLQHWQARKPPPDGGDVRSQRGHGRLLLLSLETEKLSLETEKFNVEIAKSSWSKSNCTRQVTVRTSQRRDERNTYHRTSRKVTLFTAETLRRLDQGSTV